MTKKIDMKDYPEDKKPSWLATIIVWAIILGIWGVLALGLAAAIKFLWSYIVG